MKNSNNNTYMFKGNETIKSWKLLACVPPTATS